jgi:hypothetical protein
MLRKLLRILLASRKRLRELWKEVRGRRGLHVSINLTWLPCPVAADGSTIITYMLFCKHGNLDRTNGAPKPNINSGCTSLQKTTSLRWIK